MMTTWKTALALIFTTLIALSSPVEAKFYSNDPVDAVTHIQRGNAANGFNRYAYGNNNPYKYVDPDGRYGTAVFRVGVATASCAKSAACRQTASRVTQRAVKTSRPFVEALLGTAYLNEGTRELDDLETIHDPEHPQNDPAIGELSDSELEEALKNPTNGDKVTVKGNKVFDGNTRVNEAKGRGLPGNMEIPVEELPNPPVDDDDPLGPYK